MGVDCAGFAGSAWLYLSCPLGAGVQSLCYFADVSKIGQDTAGCSAFCLLSRFVFVGLLANMALFRVLRAFLEGFGVVVWVCIVLVLCVACVALCACVVRRVKGLLRVCLPFVLLLLCLLSFYAGCHSLLWLSFFVLLHCLCGSLGVFLSFLFPFRTKRKKSAFVLRSFFTWF